MHKIFRHSLLALALVASSACELFTGTDRPNVLVTLSAVAYPQGSTIAVSVENRSGRSWFVGSVCNAGIERLVDGEWVSAYWHNCLATQRDDAASGRMQLSYSMPEIPVGETGVLYWTLPADASVGTHRVRIAITSSDTGGGEDHHLFTPHFQVFEVVALK